MSDKTTRLFLVGMLICTLLPRLGFSYVRITTGVGGVNGVGGLPCSRACVREEFRRPGHETGRVWVLSIGDRKYPLYDLAPTTGAGQRCSSVLVYAMQIHELLEVPLAHLRWVPHARARAHHIKTCSSTAISS